MAASDALRVLDKPQQVDLDRCVHCGLCLNSCPTYRQIGLEMDSPRGRIYQMNLVANGAPMTDSYVEHLELCLACRGCESACPSGVQYGRLIEAARAEIEAKVERPWTAQLVRSIVFEHLLPSRTNLRLAGLGLWLFQKTGLQSIVRASGVLGWFGRLKDVERLSPAAEMPTFYAQYGKVFPAAGAKRYKVAMLGGCIANISFARLNEATVRVLQKNGCEVHVPEAQTCCGALHLHQGLKDETRKLARLNIDALLAGGYDAIITNAAGCGSTLKEYHEILEHDTAYAGKAREFSGKMKDVTEFLASIEFNREFRPLPVTVTYQDSCHLAHGQKVRLAPRTLMRAIPELQFKEMPGSDLCCGSAGVYNVVQNEMAMELLEKKMASVALAKAEVIATANPGCLLQLRAGAAMKNTGQRVVHVVELLDEAYGGR
jgi:glycolate oxidase iron-sulfur subunit